MPYSFYGPNTRSDFLCYFLDMATPIKSVIGDSVRVLSLCLDPISINSVLVIFRVSLFALSQL